MPEVTCFYAGLIAVLYAVLSTMAAAKRGATDTPFGDGGDLSLGMALRRFGNLSEYGAMAILVLLLLELSDMPSHWLHAYGASLILFRLLHPFVLFADPGAPTLLKLGRFIAAAGTAALLLIGGIALIFASL